MLTAKKVTLKPLLESIDGIHLTAYLVNRGQLVDLKNQLRQTVDQAHEWLSPVMTAEEQSKFLEPLNALLSDAKILRQMKGNIGIFRNQDSFRLLNVPVAVEQTCQVATSFHVKPLLRWLQTDQEFLLIGIDQKAAHLYWGSQDAFKLVDSILLLESSNSYNSKEDDILNWINSWISQLTKTSKPKLFFAAESHLFNKMIRRLKYKNSVKTPVANFFTKNIAPELCANIRKLLKAESQTVVEKSLMEFRFAEEGNRTRKNIFQIARAVVQGRVRKLIVSDELSIFGKIDKSTGGLAIHPFDLDHEDDDILDDLAQMVLSQGGEVIVASRNKIPKGRPILAILEDEGEELMASANRDQTESQIDITEGSVL